MGKSVINSPSLPPPFLLPAKHSVNQTLNSGWGLETSCQARGKKKSLGGIRSIKNDTICIGVFSYWYINSMKNYV